MDEQTWWMVGWIGGVVVVLLVALLLVAAIALTRRVTGEAEKIIEGLDCVRVRTHPLREIAVVNDRLGRISAHFTDGNPGEARR